MPPSTTAVNVLVFEREDTRFAVATRHVMGVGERVVATPLPAAIAPFAGVVPCGAEYALAIDLATAPSEVARGRIPVFARHETGWLLALKADRIVGVVDLELDTVLHPALVAGRGDLDLFHAVSMDANGATLVINLAAIDARANLQESEASA